VDESVDEWATPEEVALAILVIVKKTKYSAGKIEGGSILEVRKDRQRLVFERNDLGPVGPGLTVTGNVKAMEDIFQTELKIGWGSNKSKL